MKNTWPDNLKLACDPAGGMGCLFLPIIEALGAQIVAINETLDSTFSSHEANPIKPEVIRYCEELVSQSGSDAGIAIDGDGDRVVFVDEKGVAISSDLITALLAESLLAKNPGACILHDLRSSKAVAEITHELGGRAIRSRVGHSFMKALMREHNCIVGGELSGHYYWQKSYFAEGTLETLIEILNLMGSSSSQYNADEAALTHRAPRAKTACL